MKEWEAFKVPSLFSAATARCGGSRRRRTGRQGKGRRERSSQRERAMDDMEMTM